MIIEIKDLPANQLIEKVDLHIDFIKGTVDVKTKPAEEEEKKETSNIPDEMLNGDF